MAEEKKPRQYFMQHEQMDFEIQIILGSCCYGCAEAGEVLSTVERMREGDFESWYGKWYATAKRLEDIAAGCAAAGNGLFKNPFRRRLNTLPLTKGQTANLSPGVERCLVEYFAGVDVSYAGNDALIHEEGFYREFSVSAYFLKEMCRALLQRIMDERCA